MLTTPWNRDVWTVWQAAEAAWGRPEAESEQLAWLRGLGPGDWARLDAVVRGWSWRDYMPPAGLDSTLAWGWRSFHRDGRVREAAVRALADRADAEGFLILRSADWVEQVRVPAREALVRRKLDLGAWMPLLVARDASVRAGDLAGACVAAHPEAVPALLRHPDRVTRRWMIRRHLAEPHSTAALLALLPDVPEVATTLAAFGDDAVLASMLADRRVNVRRAAWACVAEGRLPEVDLRPGLLDRALSIRCLAQRIARERGVDAASVYRSLDGRRRLVGLMEVSAPEVVELARASLHDRQVLVRVAAIAALALRMEHPEAILLDLLRSRGGAELGAVVRGLLLNRVRVGEGTLAELRAGSAEQRRAAWTLGRAAGRWERVLADLLALGEPTLVAEARADLESWRRDAGSEAGVPEPAIGARLRAAMPPAEDAPWWRYLDFVLRA